VAQNPTPNRPTVPNRPGVPRQAPYPWRILQTPVTIRDVLFMLAYAEYWQLVMQGFGAYRDRRDRIWVGSVSGLYCYDHGKWARYSTADGLTAEGDREQTEQRPGGGSQG
jgi:hypothetical protein